MKISGVNITGGIRLIAPTPTPSGPSKFVVGARYSNDPDNSGSAYVYNTDGTGEVKLTASDAAASDYFGESVAISDTKVVVGAWADDDRGSASGSVYVYNIDGTGEVKITASDGAASDTFGQSVAISDTKVVVGAYADDDAGSASGSVYVYNLDGTGEVKITASDGAQDGYFGYSVAATNTHIVVGAYADDEAGSVYVYNIDGTGEVKITASDGAASDVFGLSVAVSDTKVVVGAYADDDAGSASGSVYVYNLDGTGEQKITASDAASDDQFGYSVAMSDTKVIVGAPGDKDAGSNTGSVYVYNLDGTGQVKITASDGAQSDRFGQSVAISDTKVVVGALLTDIVGSNSGSVYVYNTDGTGEQKIQASDAASDDQFGRSVAIN
jgi:meiotically up-regulated gene 157 (Mug157) protein